MSGGWNLRVVMHDSFGVRLHDRQLFVLDCQHKSERRTWIELN